MIIPHNLNIQKRRRAHARRFLALPLLLALALTACSGNAIPGTPDSTATPAEAITETPDPRPPRTPTPNPNLPDLTGETISIYHLGDASSQYAEFITLPMIRGFEAMVEAINDQGGVFGAQIELHFIDTEGVVENTVSEFEALLEEGKEMPLLVLYSPEDEEALFERIAEERIPALSAGLNHAAVYGLEGGYLFGAAPTGAEQFAFFLDYLTSNWGTLSPQGAGDQVRVAYLSWPTPFGQAALSDEALAYADQLGVEIVANETFGFGPLANTTNAIVSAQIAGANVIYTNATAFGPANLLNDLNNLAGRENFIVGGSFFALDPAIHDYLADPAYAANFYAPFPMAWWDDDNNSAIEVLLKLDLPDLANAGERSVGRLLMMGAADLAHHALEAAVLEVGYENLSGQAVYEALTAMEDYQVLGGLMTVDYGGGRRSPGLLQIRAIEGDDQSLMIVQDFSAVPELPPGG